MKLFAIPVKIGAINLGRKNLKNLPLCSDTTLGSCHSQMAHPYRLPQCSLNHQQRRFYHSNDDHDINTVSVLFIDGWLSIMEFQVTYLHMCPKGHLISEWFFEVVDFLQKTNKNTSHTSKNEFICSFFGRIHSLTICFRN